MLVVAELDKVLDDIQSEQIIILLCTVKTVCYVPQQNNNDI